MNTYELVFLDADETLFDFRKTEKNALSQSFGQFGLELTEDIILDYDEINKKLWSNLEKGEIHQEKLKSERFRLLFQKIKVPMDPELFGRAYIEWLSRGSFLLENAEGICEYLSKKYTLVMITNGIKNVQMPRINNSPIKKYITSVIISEEAKSSKPGKEIFDYACNAVDFHRKEKMIIIGDSLSSDIQGGINYGIDTCWVNLASATNETNVAPTYEINDLLELKTLL